MTNQHALRVLAFFLLVILLINLGWACAASALPRARADGPPQGPQTAPASLLVKVAPQRGATPPAPPQTAPSGADAPFLRVPDGDWYAVTPPTGKSLLDVRADLAARDDVRVVQTNERLTVQDAAPQTTDPLFSQQYALTTQHVTDAWPYADGSGVTVYVLDTGGDFSHSDLRLVKGADYVQGDASPDDVQGHGTHVAGIVGATRDNGLGVAGVSRAALVVVRVLGDDGSGYTDAIARGIQWAAAQPAPRKVINMSLGGGGQNAALRDAVDYARRRNTLVVAAAGNSSTSQPTSPAIYADLKVCAVNQSNQRAPFSNYGQNVNICGAGVDVLSTVMRSGPSIFDPSGYKALSGTSMAAPNVAGVAALAWAAHPTYTALQVRDLLLSTATPLGDSLYYGRGLVNARAAVGAVTPPPGVTPAPLPPIPTPTPVVGGDFARRVYDLVNQQRTQNGLRALPWSDALSRAAAAHNVTMDEANCFSHQCPGEADPNARARAAGWNGLYVLEDIARGYLTPEDVVLDGWMRSPGHRAAILSDRATEIGADFLNGASGAWQGMWWTLEMGVGTAIPAPTAAPTRPPQPPPGCAVVMTLDYDLARFTTVDDAYWTLSHYEAFPGQLITWAKKSLNAEDPRRTPPGLLPHGWTMTVTVPGSAPNAAEAWADLDRFYNRTHRDEPGLAASVRCSR